MGRSTYDAIQTEIAYINDLVEFERSMGGQDDELEDEVWDYHMLFKLSQTFNITRRVTKDQ